MGVTAEASVADRVGFHVQALLPLLQELLVTPLRDRVLVLPLEEPFVQRKGALYVVEKETVMKPWQAIVIALGAGPLVDGQEVRLDLQAGDVVIVGRYTGEVVLHKQLECRLVRHGDILAKLVDS